jgi:ATP-dependent phosphoenolpyruvate carboxykinase
MDFILEPGFHSLTFCALRYEHALRHEEGSFITSTGALAVSSGAKTGRSPADKRIVDEPVGWWAFTNEVRRKRKRGNKKSVEVRRMR